MPSKHMFAEIIVEFWFLVIAISAHRLYENFNYIRNATLLIFLF